MEETRKLMKAIRQNSTNPKLAWHLFKRILSSPSTSTSTHHHIPTITRILLAANMHHEINHLTQLITSNHPNTAHHSLISILRILAQSPHHIDSAFSHFKSLRTHFPSTPLPLPLYHLLLRSSLHHNRPHFVTSLYTDMIQSRVNPQTYTFNLLLQSLCESNALDHALQLFDKMSEKGCQPNEFTVGILVRGFCRAGKTKEALEFVDKKLCFDVNRVVFNTLVSSFCKQDMNDEAERLVERMREKGLFPDVVTFNSRISALCRAGKVFDASRIFRDMQMDGENWDFQSLML